MANDDRNTRRDRYRDNDDVRDPASDALRNDPAPDSRNEARGNARENVGDHGRGTAAAPRGPEQNDRTANGRPVPDEYDEDLARDNRRGREGEGMGDLARDTRAGAAGFTDDRDAADARGDDAHNGWRSHARQGQAESPVERTHNEPRPKVQGHGRHDGK